MINESSNEINYKLPRSQKKNKSVNKFTKPIPTYINYSRYSTNASLDHTRPETSPQNSTLKASLLDDTNKNSIKRPLKKRKILFLGAPGVGKSAMIVRFKDNIFLDYYEPTIENIFKKSLIFHDEIVELEIMDIDGQTEYTIFSFSKLTFGINGYVLCYSIENRQSFELLKILHSKLINLVGRDIPKILVANKTDLTQRRAISSEEGKSLAEFIGCPFIECSAKSSLNIDRAFYFMLREIDRYENSVDIKGVYCQKMLEMFAKKEKFMTILLYIFTAMNCIESTFIIIIGFYLGIYFFEDNTIKVGLVLLIGIWGNIFNAIGLYGIHKKKKDYIFYNAIGEVISFLLCFCAILFNFISPTLCEGHDTIIYVKNVKVDFFYIFLPFCMLNNVILLIMTIMFQNVYHYELPLFYGE